MEKPSEKRIKLFANENFYGCSPQAKKAIKEKINEVNYYSDPPSKLEEALASKYNLSISNIVAGGGSVRLIDGIIQSLVNTDDEILTFDRTFVAYAQFAASYRKKCVKVPLDNYCCSVKNLIPEINPNTRIIFIANPNNPTGTIISHGELKNLLQSVSSKIFVVIDEAYREYVSDQTYPDSLSLQKEFSNLIILRTFSKAYGLAGLRIGYAIAPETVISMLKQSRIPHFMNCFSSGAAIAALKDQQFITRSAEKNNRERNFLYKNLKRLGYTVVPSQGNFIYLFFNDENQKMKVFDALTALNIHICNLSTFGQDKSLRIGIGDRTCSKRITECLKRLNPPA